MQNMAYTPIYMALTEANIMLLYNCTVLHYDTDHVHELLSVLMFSIFNALMGNWVRVYSCCTNSCTIM